MQIAKPCFHEPNGCTCVMSQHHFGKSRQWSLSLSLCLNFPTFAKHRLSRVRPQFGESEERLWRWTTDQCSEVSSDSLARSVVKCDITAQYSTVQHSTAQYSTVQRTRAGEQTEWGGRPSAEAVFTSSHHSTLCTHKQLFFVTPTTVLTSQTCNTSAIGSAPCSPHDHMQIERWHRSD